MSLKRILLINILLVLTVGQAWGLASDADQPINIDSDSATYDEKQQVSTYVGHVHATQGSIKVEGDKLVVYLKDGNVSKMVTTGQPSHFRQIPAEGKEEMVGEGLVNEYYPDQNLLIFMHKASVRQGDAKQSSEYIQYDTKNSLLKAGEPNSNSTRVHSVIKPKSKDGSKAK
ncbi:MAG: lipopolysaccharide transport periplasmic protein LptA [Methylococcaceae bacterium]|jgi:lipopolysaccharide export system protein LptA|nr:lipopolysaccharide transport periplasmic protein LptA [Methylococcaceae bacterium]